jgi:hypothetical protein
MRNAADQRPDCSHTTHFCGTDTIAAPSLGRIPFNKLGQLELRLVAFVADESQLD